MYRYYNNLCVCVCVFVCSCICVDYVGYVFILGAVTDATDDVPDMEKMWLLMLTLRYVTLHYIT